MITINEILYKIDKSKMVTQDDGSFHSMCESEFDIYEYFDVQENELRIAYCWYHSWICTDTQVGIRVWYLDNKPVCISWQPYRKSDEQFGWISPTDFVLVQDYAESLRSSEYDENKINIIDDDAVNDIVEAFNNITHKEHEKKNILN